MNKGLYKGNGSNLTPIGSIKSFASAATPIGWLVCDGTAVSRTTYAALFAAIGIAWGYGDNSTTFNLPDLRGRFLRGKDGGIARDPDRASRTACNTGGNTGDNIGSVQPDQYTSHNHGGGNHNHSASDGGHTHSFPSDALPGAHGTNNLAGGSSYGGGMWEDMGTYRRNIQTGYASISVGYTAPISSNGGTETRPLNANVNYIIKY